MFGIQLIDRKIFRDLMMMFGLNETLDQFTIVSSVCWYGHVLWREDGHFLRRALDFKVEGLLKKGRLIRKWKKQVEEERVKVGLRRENVFCRSE